MPALGLLDAGLALDFDLGGAVWIVRSGLACSRLLRALVEEIGLSKRRFPAFDEYVIPTSKSTIPARMSFSISPSKCCMPLGVAIRASHREETLPSVSPFSNVISRTHRRFEDFHSSDTPFAVFARKETLGNNVAKGFTKTGADGLLVGHGENSNDALHRFSMHQWYATWT